jgi:hypothetical protein
MATAFILKSKKTGAYFSAIKTYVSSDSAEVLHTPDIDSAMKFSSQDLAENGMAVISYPHGYDIESIDIEDVVKEEGAPVVKKK